MFWRRKQRYREAHDEFGVPVGFYEMGHHHRCSVCGIMGHDPDMDQIASSDPPHLHDWVHVACIAGSSKYERRGRSFHECK